ncbi:PEP-utilizing enzyme [Natrarchaeobius oligotrophus]|uniref:Phosphoenolpyruvate synthase n=1 Tax=Natrarchaeobius chitinivorans TaxID=1679083 RepID=A0A3N6PRA7_NATCH|nr:PEP-utilizing enzyme [Natrarchaeobius chitinivorans]RQH01956.1 hypothetical protein EA472_06535 [Natrarchaeobius chitinivorans]
MQPPVVVILGAGQPFSGTDPAALTRTSGDRRALDWLLESFQHELEEPEIHFVGGYRIDEVIEQYPDIHFSRNEDWEESGTVGSLLSAPLPDERELYVCYADTVFQADVVESLREDAGDATVAVDTEWRTRYTDRDEESLERAEKVRLEGGEIAAISTEVPLAETDAEFTGLLRLSPDCIERLLELASAGVVDETDDLPSLVRLLNVDVDVAPVDVRGNWAELETADDLARFVLDTKANTLRRLESVVERSVIEDQYTFTAGEWEADPDAVLGGVRATFDDDVIVRSSALAEDTWDESNAGRFESVLDVPVDDPTALEGAIQQVVDSYPNGNPDDQVLVQPMLTDVDHSGVVMTRSVETGSPYYVINYDAATGSTESVTDGSGEAIRTAIVRKAQLDGATDVEDVVTSHAQAPAGISLEDVLAAVRELEDVIGHDSLDVEFATTADGTVHVLQVRPMALDPADETVDDGAIAETVDEARRRFHEAQAPSPFVLGERTIFGVMPDWNPAEIIGRKPKLLADSLYRYLVMDEVWARQRAEYGYRDVRPQPLMRSFAGQPYVDVRAVFNSFVPASVPDELAERLVSYSLDRLEANPELHDKVEFEIAITCLTFDFETRAEPMLEAGFTLDELEPLREGLKGITHTAFDRVDDDYERVDRLEERYAEIDGSELPPLRKARALLEDCRRFGTLPFAHLARSGFVAVSLLRSLERKGVLESEDVARFLNSLNTVAREFERDGHRVAAGELAWEAFVERYGHLRPGTYEITSPAYANDPETYLRPVAESAEKPPSHPDPGDAWDEGTRAAIEDELETIGLPADCDRFVEFLTSAIEGREYAKFVFSRNLSEAIEQLAAFGERHGLDREQLSHVPLEDLFELSANHPPGEIGAWLANRAREGRRRHVVAQSVELPPLLLDDADFDVFERPAREANFVTDRTIRAEVVEIETIDETTTDLDDRIVLIPQADPGYDWLFGHDIAGLVTMYGGANSHMAIRAAEFDLPAAIGVGENRYEQLRAADVLELDCSGRTIRER